MFSIYVFFIFQYIKYEVHFYVKIKGKRGVRIEEGNLADCREIWINSVNGIK